jgi:hypothetical protein
MIPEVLVQNALNEHPWELVDSDPNFSQRVVAFRVNNIFTVLTTATTKDLMTSIVQIPFKRTLWS